MLQLNMDEKEKRCVLLGRHLKQLRQLLAATQEDLARLSGISKERISRIENGAYVMRWVQFTAFLFIFFMHDKTKEYLLVNKLITPRLMQFFQMKDKNMPPDLVIKVSKLVVQDFDTDFRISSSVSIHAEQFEEKAEEGKEVSNMTEFTRRLPVYMLLDCSGSMMGEPIEAVKQGVKALLSELKGDPQALETAYLSVITFNSQAQQIIPLTELMLFKEPQISAGGATALGGALNVLADCIKNEVRKSTDTQKGDWKTLVFILTDGSPTDIETFHRAAENLKKVKTANIIACAAGSNADTTYLKQVTESVLMMNTLSAGDMAKFFAWVSGSIKLSSKSVDAKPGTAVKLPPPPEGFVIVP